MELQAQIKVRHYCHLVIRNQHCVSLLSLIQTKRLECLYFFPPIISRNKPTYISATTNAMCGDTIKVATVGFDHFPACTTYIFQSLCGYMLFLYNPDKPILLKTCLFYTLMFSHIPSEAVQHQRLCTHVNDHRKHVARLTSYHNWAYCSGHHFDIKIHVQRKIKKIKKIIPSTYVRHAEF